jgi:hypothetical protein
VQVIAGAMYMHDISHPADCPNAGATFRTPHRTVLASQCSLKRNPVLFARKRKEKRKQIYIRIAERA